MEGAAGGTHVVGVQPSDTAGLIRLGVALSCHFALDNIDMSMETPETPKIRYGDESRRATAIRLNTACELLVTIRENGREAGGTWALSDKYGLGLSVPRTRHVGKVDVDVDAGDQNIMFRECK